MKIRRLESWQHLICQHLPNINTQDKIAWAANHFRNLGAKWSRGAGEQVTWFKIEPVLGRGYDWSNSDKVLKRVYENGGDGFKTAERQYAPGWIKI